MEQQDLPSLLNQYATNKVNGMFTSMPCVVVGNPNLEEQRVDVRPLVNKITTDNKSREHPVIMGVPLIFPGSESSQFSFPVRVGDTVLCVFSQRSIARFKMGSKTPSDPMDFGKYSKNDAMAIPGLFTFPDARNNPNKRSLSHSVDDTVMTHNIGTSSECEVRLKSSGDVIINSPSKVEVNCEESVINASSSVTVDTPVASFTGDVNIAGTLTVDVDTVTAGISFVGHKHTGVTSGSSNTGGPV